MTDVIWIMNIKASKTIIFISQSELQYSNQSKPQNFSVSTKLFLSLYTGIH